MLVKKYMSAEEYMSYGKDADCGRLEELYEEVIKIVKPGMYLGTDMHVLYTSTHGAHTSVFGHGELVQAVSYREGYGYTIFEMGERGSWWCKCKGVSDKADIVFWDGDFKEVVEKIAKCVYKGI